MSYNVYKVRYTITIPDPDMPSPRYHHVVFVETNPDDESGMIHEVNGDITSGMQYASTMSKRPEEAETFYSREFLGTVDRCDYPDKVDEVLKAQPVPPKQKSFNIKTMKTEQMKPDGTFYLPGEPRPPMIKCTEWTVNQAIPALYTSGVLKK